MPTEGEEGLRLRSVRFLTRRVVVIVGVVVVAVGAGIGTWLGTRSSASAATTTTQVVTAALGTIQQTVAATGTLEPATQANVNFAVSGKVTAVDVSVGQTVTSGQTLATVNDSALVSSLDSAQETLQAAEAKLAADQSSGAPASQINADNSAVTAAQSQVAGAQQQVDEATLTAPMAGTVASVSLAVGNEVSGASAGGGGNGGGNSSASSSSGSSAEIVIIDTGSWLVQASVDDTSIGQLTQGDQARIVPNGSSTTVFGTVASIGLIASSSSSGVATFPVTIDVTGDPPGLYSGTSANVTIIVKQLTDVLTVPSAALRFQNGNTYVELVRSGGNVPQQVTVGATSGGQAQITSGLSAGDQVLETIVRQTGGTTGRTRTGGFGGGGFGGGGFGGGGFGGGGFGGGG